MPTWLDSNHIKGEMSDEQFRKHVTAVMKKRVKREKEEKRKSLYYGNDGFTSVYKEVQQHAGISYVMEVFRYFAVFRRITGKGLVFDFQADLKCPNKIGKYIELSQAEGLQPPYEIQGMLNLSDFLHKESDHLYMENWSLKRQWKEINKWAQHDCERVALLPKQFDAKVKDLQKELIDFIKQIKGEAK